MRTRRATRIVTYGRSRSKKPRCQSALKILNAESQCPGPKQQGRGEDEKNPNLHESHSIPARLWLRGGEDSVSETYPTLEEAVAAAKGDDSAVVSAITPDNRVVFVRSDYRTANADPGKPPVSEAEFEQAKAALLAAAHVLTPATPQSPPPAQPSADLPTPPDFSANTHKPYRAKLANLIALAKAGDVAGLRAIEIKPYSSSPKALFRAQLFVRLPCPTNTSGPKS